MYLSDSLYLSFFLSLLSLFICLDGLILLALLVGKARKAVRRIAQKIQKACLYWHKSYVMRYWCSSLANTHV